MGEKEADGIVEFVIQGLTLEYVLRRFRKGDSDGSPESADDD